MKLRVRQTLLSLFIILLVMSVFLYLYIGLQTRQTLQDARDNGEWQLEAFAEHIKALERTANMEPLAPDTTRQALVQYTFATYAHLLQSGDRAFSLVANDRYLYNLSTLDPKERLPMPLQNITASQMTRQEGQLHLVSARNLRVLEMDISLYLTENISQMEGRVHNMVRTAQLALVASLLFCVLVLPPLIRKSLSPLEKLTAAADRIAGGAYAMRSNVQTADEVGALSRSFDRMADTVEEKISSLEATNRQQELLIGALTHELKTPMTAIIGYSNSLLTMPLPEDRKSEALQQIHVAALRTERLSQKMMELISLSHEADIEMKPVSLKRLFESIQAAMEPVAKEAGIHLVTQDEKHTLSGDNDLLFSALTNLIDNAIKASTAGQTVVLSAGLSGKNLVLSVRDQGRGIPKDELPKLSQAFYRVDKARSRKLGGAGLGLAICRLIAQAHGGSLEFGSLEGRGTTVSLVLPERSEDEES